MKKTICTLLCFKFIIFSLLFSSAAVGQTIRGVVVDKATQQPLPFSTIRILDSHPPGGAAGDESGRFVIDGIQPGRYAIEASYVGYESVVQREVLTGTGKEVQLTFELEPKQSELEEVTVRAFSQDKARAINSMAMVSSLSFNVEEA